MQGGGRPSLALSFAYDLVKDTPESVLAELVEQELIERDDAATQGELLRVLHRLVDVDVPVRAAQQAFPVAQLGVSTLPTSAHNDPDIRDILEDVQDEEGSEEVAVLEDCADLAVLRKQLVGQLEKEKDDYQRKLQKVHRGEEEQRKKLMEERDRHSIEVRCMSAGGGGGGARGMVGLSRGVGPP
jgi:hypothetical protein